ncbi:WD repeat-containing protein 75 [Rhinoderma darwinii]|uniref:WD repeat-containing protein 75 n=1 Tax=Rhinoderma darwinii TaxID=43563 RepID=UPI003F66BE1E
MVIESDIRVVQCGGSRINHRRPLLSADSKYLLCVSGNFIKIFSTVTEDCIHVLWSHNDLVTGIEFNPNNPLQLYSCSLDGTVKLWDFVDGILMKTFLIGLQIFGLYTSSKYVYVTTQNDSSETFQLMSIKLPKTTEQECEVKEMTVLFTDVDQSPKSTAVGRNGNYIVTVKGLCLLVYYFKNKKLFRFPLSSTSKKGAHNTFTVVTCHPSEDCIATGHKDGRIRLWRNFNHKKNYTYSSLHWHHDSVADLAFSAQGTMLFSGGVESVLVQWSHSLEHKKEFLPRLGAAIEHIATSPDGSLLCTSHNDNKISIIDTSLKVTGIIQGLVKGNDVKTGLILDPRTKALVLNGKPGHLQFYSLHDEKQLYNLDIVQREFINQSGLQYIDLVKAAFNAKGNWLATVEELRKGTDHLEVQMKFWEYSDKLQSFVLNTTINLPHEDQITSLSFQCGCDSEKDAPTLVTTGNDGLFKVWVLEDNSDIYRQSSGWSCDFLGSYHGFKATACSFSEDGSLLAVSFEDIITIWESLSWDLKHTLCQPPGKIRSLCFGRMSSSKYLLASTDNGFINCWDLLTCNLKWKAQLDAFVLQPDCVSENIAAFSVMSGRSTMFIFNPADPMPLYVHADICRGCVQWAVFVPRDVPEVLPSKTHKWLIKSQLYFLTETQDLMTFSTKSSEERLKPLSKQLAPEESLPFTPFFTLLEKNRQKKQLESKIEMQVEKSGFTGGKTQEYFAVKELLHTPAHVLPPAAILCSLFVDSLLISQQHESTEQGGTDLDMESENDEEDSDEDLHEAPESKEPMAEYSYTTPVKLSKSEEKELRSIRKGDFTWALNCILPFA